jgi:serine/threonine-protein kinase
MDVSMDEIRKPVDKMKAGGRDADSSMSRAFDRDIDFDVDSESLLGLVAGVDELQGDLEAQEDEKPAPSKPPAKKPAKTKSSPSKSTTTSTQREPSRKPAAKIHLAASGPRRIGRYLLEQEIGKGATGSVYLARDTKLDRAVAIKTVRYRLGQPGIEVVALKEKVYAEARAIARLNHPNIAAIYDVDEAQDFCYIVMEYLGSATLGALMNQEHRLEWERALRLMIQASHALDYAHDLGIFHLDVKPANLILPHGDGALKVADFSVDKLSHRVSPQSGSESAAHLYVAPEQREGNPVDHRADIFSLGVVLYEMLTGEAPFIDGLASVAVPAQRLARKSYMPPSLQNLELPPEIDDIVARALSRNPAARYQTAAEFREALGKLRKRSNF